MGITHGWTSTATPDGSDVTPSNFNTHLGGPIIVGWDSQSALPSGLVHEVYARSNGTINTWTIIGDQTGSATFAISKCARASYPGSLASIVAAAAPTMSSAATATSSTLTGWTTAVTAGDVIRVTLSSVSGLNRVQIVLDF